jgi:hypothetical protein
MQHMACSTAHALLFDHNHCFIVNIETTQLGQLLLLLLHTCCSCCCSGLEQQ